MTIAVKELAYFVCGSGDLTLEFFSNRDVNEGTKAHEYLQSLYNSKSKSEVYIKSNLTVDGKEYTLHGYIDGLLNIKNKIIIEEIKSTTSDLDLINLCLCNFKAKGNKIKRSNDKTTPSQINTQTR